MVTNQTLKEIVTLLCSENTAKKKYIFELIDEDERLQEQETADFIANAPAMIMEKLEEQKYFEKEKDL